MQMKTLMQNSLPLEWVCPKNCDVSILNSKRQYTLDYDDFWKTYLLFALRCIESKHTRRDIAGATVISSRLITMAQNPQLPFGQRFIAYVSRMSLGARTNRFDIARAAYEGLRSFCNDTQLHTRHYYQTVLATFKTARIVLAYFTGYGASRSLIANEVMSAERQSFVGPMHRHAVAELLAYTSLLIGNRLEYADKLTALAVRTEPENAVVLSLRAKHLEYTGRYEEAEAVAQRGLRIKPDALSMHLTLAYIHKYRGHIGQALAHVRLECPFNRQAEITTLKIQQWARAPAPAVICDRAYAVLRKYTACNFVLARVVGILVRLPSRPPSAITLLRKYNALKQRQRKSIQTTRMVLVGILTRLAQRRDPADVAEAHMLIERYCDRLNMSPGMVRYLRSLFP